MSVNSINSGPRAFDIDPFTLCTAWSVNRTKLPTDWVICQDFPTYKQALTNQFAGNDKFLTAHISKCMFWNGELSDYISRENKYILNSVLYYSIGLTKMLFF